MRVEMMPNLPSLVVWQTGTIAAMNHTPLETLNSWVGGRGIALGKVAGRRRSC